MSAPVHTLDASSDTAQDAALLMSRHGIRHVPVTEGGRARRHRLRARPVRAAAPVAQAGQHRDPRGAPTWPRCAAGAADIRRFARNLLGQGVRARQLTELISHLNDVLTERLVQLVAQRRGLDLAARLLAGLRLRGPQRADHRHRPGQRPRLRQRRRPSATGPRWLAFAREVNEALDACGYPLCKGNVMASNPECCLTPAEWLQRFAHWIEHGAPEDLLNASIYFDLRAAGRQRRAGARRCAS